MRFHLAILIVIVFLAACNPVPAALPTQKVLPTLSPSATPELPSQLDAATKPDTASLPTVTATTSPLLHVTLTRQSINAVLTELAPTAATPSPSATTLDTAPLTPAPIANGQPIVVNEPQTVWLAMTAPVEFVYAGEAEEAITITVRSLAAPGEIDPVVKIFNPADELLATNDDHDSPHTNLYKLDAALDDLILPDTGDYRIHIDTPYRQGNIEVEIAGTATTVADAEQANTTTITDTLAVGQHYQFPITVREGEILTILLHTTNGTFDPYLVLLTEDGETVLDENDDHATDIPELAEVDSALEDVEIPAEGRYIIEISDFYDEAGGDFELTIIYQQLDS